MIQEGEDERAFKAALSTETKTPQPPRHHQPTFAHVGNRGKLMELAVSTAGLSWRVGEFPRQLLVNSGQGSHLAMGLGFAGQTHLGGAQKEAEVCSRRLPSFPHSH